MEHSADFRAIVSNDMAEIQASLMELDQLLKRVDVVVANVNTRVGRVRRAAESIHTQLGDLSIETPSHISSTAHLMPGNSSARGMYQSSPMAAPPTAPTFAQRPGTSPGVSFSNSMTSISPQPQQQQQQQQPHAFGARGGPSRVGGGMVATPTADEDWLSGAASPRPSSPKTGNIAVPKYSTSMRSGHLVGQIGLPTTYDPTRPEDVREVGHRQGLIPNFKCEGALVGHKSAITSICVVGDFMFTSAASPLPETPSAPGAPNVPQHEIKMWDVSSFQCLATLEGHVDTVTALQCEGHVLISASLDETVRVWNIQKLEAVCTWDEHTGGVTSLTIAGTTVFSGSKDHTIKVWDLQSLEFLGTLTGHNDAVHAVVHLERVLLSGSNDGAIKVWDLDNMVCVRTLQGHTEAVTCLCVSAEYFFSSSADLTIRAWDWQNLACIKVLKGHTDVVTTLLVTTHATGKMLLSGSKDATLRSWSMRPLKQLAVMQKHTDEITGLASHGLRVLSCSADKSVRVWK